MTAFIPQDRLDDTHIAAAGEILRRGGLVVFPTETVYGLGANALDAKAATKIYAAKGRPSDNPLIVHIAFPSDAEALAVTCDAYYKLADAFMPGPLTVILQKKDVIPSATSGGLDTVGLRCPVNEIAHKLILAAGVPIAAPSANLSGKPSPTRAEHIRADLDGKVDMILDGGECAVGVESTIVKLEKDGGATLLRPGGITLEALERVLGRVKIADAVTGALAEGARPLSPGMKYRHYAPRAPLTLLDGSDDKRIAYCQSADKDTLLLVFEEEADLFSGHRTVSLGKKDDRRDQLHRLFAALIEADAQQPNQILAPLPATDGLSLALYNRLIRAAAHHIQKL
ncbi:MAG: threonylcarbamoyl-AMP synthase [Clostridia bacterium]|nr:threonylcarbamoyl-AMP synthase [Clostridia bacterium]